MLPIFHNEQRSICGDWSGRRDLNPRPTAWEADALPLSYTRVGAILACGCVPGPIVYPGPIAPSRKPAACRRANMSVAEPNEPGRIDCPRCGQQLCWPSGLSMEDKQHLAGARRRSSLEGVQLAKTKLHLELGVAKALLAHVTRARGRRHRCTASTAGEVSICSRCRSVNFDW